MNVTAEDIAEMRRDGSFAEFLRHQIAQQQAMRQPTARLAAVPPPADPGHRPGAWPAGTRPPASGPRIPAEAWQQALADYRAWLDSGQLGGNYGCGCPGCVALGRSGAVWPSQEACRPPAENPRPPAAAA